MGYLKSEGNVGDVPALVPVPAEVVGELEGLLSVDVEADVGPGGLTGGVGEDDAGCQVPDGALPVGLDSLEVAFNVRPVPVGLLLLVVLARFLIH